MTKTLKVKVWNLEEKAWQNGTQVCFSSGEVKAPEGCELVQAIGRTDKNGTEIYDGDLIKDYFTTEFGSKFESVGAVAFCYKCNAWELKLKSQLEATDGKLGGYSIDSTGEVVGHILTNPELLK